MRSRGEAEGNWPREGKGRTAKGDWTRGRRRSEWPRDGKLEGVGLERKLEGMSLRGESKEPRKGRVSPQEGTRRALAS